MKNNKTKENTVSFHLAPNFNKDNCYIRNGYRRKLSVNECFLSTFVWTNESINIWSHFLGFLVFVGLLIYDGVVVKQTLNTSTFELFIAVLVLFSFMACMLLSSLYHTLNCHSSQMFKTCLSFDIFGISLAFLAIFISGIYYGFWCDQHSHLRNVYCALVLVLFSAAMFLVLVPSLKTEKLDSARIVLFIGWALSGVVPTLHWIILHMNSNSGMIQIFLPRIAVMYILSGIAVTFYLLRIPERFFPGRFDYVGASHQFWHVIMFFALYYWHNSGILYATHRHTFGCEV